MNASKRFLACGLLLATAWTTGCPPAMPRTRLPLAEIVGQYNRNAARVPQLWARAKIEPTYHGMSLGSLVPWDELSFVLVLFKNEDRLGPQDFVLVGSVAGVQLSRIGCSTADGAYYFWHDGNKPALYWGRNRLAGAPGVDALPIDPLQILAILSICELPGDLTQLPAVALSMNTTPGEYAYVVTYLARQPVSNRILFRREVHFNWSDDKKPRPFRVDLFDGEGMRVLTADLSDYRPIERVFSEGRSDYRATMAEREKPAPEMPTDIRIRWPGTAKGIRIVLSEMRIDPAGGGELKACLLWDKLPDHIARRPPVDRDVEHGAGTR